MISGDSGLRVDALATHVLDKARQRGLMVAAAESCTGGLVAAALTAISGSSDVFERGFVTYSNDAKISMLGVDAALIARYGAVSPQVAVAMTEGALRQSLAHIAVSITGIAGPGSGTASKPVGLVYLAASKRKSTDRAAIIETISHEARFGDSGREKVRAASVIVALELLLRVIDHG